MATVREITLDVLRELGMTALFGNPGSTEIPFLRDFPDDFQYVLGLQEATVLGMADGFTPRGPVGQRSLTCTRGRGLRMRWGRW